jgi:colanic acid/amylovoran biosynthesis glycosyltransferase
MLRAKATHRPMTWPFDLSGYRARRMAETTADSRCVCIVQPELPTPSETFIGAHAARLPLAPVVVHGDWPCVDCVPVLSMAMHRRLARRLLRVFVPRSLDYYRSAGYLSVFRSIRPSVVLAEYGPTGVHVLDACQELGIPLVVHFHGYDASVYSVLEKYRDGYARLFGYASAVIAVSRAMQRRLAGLGAPSDNVKYIPYGVDCDFFSEAHPDQAGPVFVAVGRFTEKKAPHLTLLAFAEVIRQFPEAKLRMIGDGPLLAGCKELSNSLRLGSAVTFLGVRSPADVSDEMKGARCFIQHSVEATNGDSEGTPVAVLEAGASGLPVVATRHAGIPDVVLDGVTGLLVTEHDVMGMAERMLDVARHPDLAQRLGHAARQHVRQNYSSQHCMSQLWMLLQDCAKDR